MCEHYSYFLSINKWKQNTTTNNITYKKASTTVGFLINTIPKNSKKENSKKKKFQIGKIIKKFEKY